MRVKSKYKNENKKKKKLLSLYDLHSLEGLRSAVCILHGLHFGVAQFVMSCLFT